MTGVEKFIVTISVAFAGTMAWMIGSAVVQSDRWMAAAQVAANTVASRPVDIAIIIRSPDQLYLPPPTTGQQMRSYNAMLNVPDSWSAACPQSGDKPYMVLGKVRVNGYNEKYLICCRRDDSWHPSCTPAASTP